MHVSDTFVRMVKILGCMHIRNTWIHTCERHLGAHAFEYAHPAWQQDTNECKYHENRISNICPYDSDRSCECAWTLSCTGVWDGTYDVPRRSILVILRGGGACTGSHRLPKVAISTSGTFRGSLSPSSHLTAPILAALHTNCSVNMRRPLHRFAGPSVIHASIPTPACCSLR